MKIFHWPCIEDDVEELSVYCTLPFGVNSIFTAVADAMEWIARQQRVTIILHYVDDFLVICHPGSAECMANVTLLLLVFEHLGISIAVDKLEGPTPVITFLGKELDTIHGINRLPTHKLEESQNLIIKWVGRKSCLKQDLESLIGK